jgi:hypothetical protein
VRRSRAFRFLHGVFDDAPLHAGMCRGLLNLQTGANRDLRYAAIELGFAPRMMELGLASTQ